MKRFLLVLSLVALGAMVWAAAPTNTFQYVKIGSATATAEWSDAAWTLVDSIIVSASDTGRVEYEVTGTVLLPPKHKLYLGLGNDSGITIPTYDTVIVSNAFSSKTSITIPFYYRVVDSFPDGAVDDTVYLFIANVGSNMSTTLNNLIMSSQITDLD